MQDKLCQQQALIITGMHRSGTSLTAALLQSAEVNIGQRLMASSEANAKGHFEDLDFYELHASILHSQGVSREGWTTQGNIHVPEQYLEQVNLILKERRCLSGIWGWKDPRTVLFLDFWLEQIPEAKFVFVFRSPWEVIDSLYRRGDEAFLANPNFAVEVWTHYNQTLLNFYTRYSNRCLLIDIREIAGNPEILTKAMKDRLGLSLELPKSDVFDNSLLHQQSYKNHRALLIEHYFSEAVGLYRKLISKATSQDFSTEVLSDQVLPSKRYKAWALQDWIDIRRSERELKFSSTRLQETQTQLQETQTQLQQTQTLLSSTQTELVHSRAVVQKLETEDHHLRSHVNWLQEVRTRLENENRILYEGLEQFRNRVRAIETSKFWKIRQAWFRLRGILGLSEAPFVPPNIEQQLAQAISSSTPQTQSNIEDEGRSEKPSQFDV